MANKLYLPRLEVSQLFGSSLTSLAELCLLWPCWLCCLEYLSDTWMLFFLKCRGRSNFDWRASRSLSAACQEAPGVQILPCVDDSALDSPSGFLSLIRHEDSLYLELPLLSRLPLPDVVVYPSCSASFPGAFSPLRLGSLSNQESDPFEWEIFRLQCLSERLDEW